MNRAAEEREAHIRSYKLRTSRIGPTRYDAIARLWPSLGVDVDGQQLDLEALFGRKAPAILEIGFGMGEATAAMAAADPEFDVLAVDVHTPGVGALVRQIEADGLTNVRVAHGDAVVLLRDMLAAQSLAGIRMFFPDPWPKARHAKRRLLSPSFCDLAVSRLEPEGFFHFASDWASYAEQARTVLMGHPQLEPVARAPWRPTTRFEKQGIEAGRHPVDVVARRRAE